MLAVINMQVVHASDLIYSDMPFIVRCFSYRRQVLQEMTSISLLTSASYWKATCLIVIKFVFVHLLKYITILIKTTFCIYFYRTNIFTNI